MRQMGKRIGICLLLAAVCWTVGIVRDRAFLNRELIRLHVVANSDSDEDQAVKLRVRDAVLGSIRSDLKMVGDINQAKAYLRENLPRIQAAANRTLEAAGVDAQAVVTLEKEAFDIRRYDTFSLPAGVYESLRIVIGEGAGKNWWCVAFPPLCTGAVTEEELRAAMETEDYGIISEQDGYLLKFKIIELWESLKARLQ